jgi:hypothetical protein
VLTPPWLIALALVVGLVVLIPARRLQLAALSSRTIGWYALAVWALAMLVAIVGGATRVLVPILLVAYLAPFVAAPDTVRRVLRQPEGGSGGGAPPMKDVTPRDDDPGDGAGRS